MGVNVFTDEVGSRIVLDYESETKETVVPPLPDPHAALTKTTAGNDAPPTAAPEPVRIVDISKNKGTATITLEGKKYTLTHAAAYRSKQNGEKTVQLLFADKPIPFARLQELLLTEDDVDMSDLFESSWPGHIRISVGQYISFSFNSGGVGVGNSIDDPVNELKITKDRVTGTLKMREPIEVFDDKMFVETTIDGVLTPNTSRGELTPWPSPGTAFPGSCRKLLRHAVAVGPAALLQLLFRPPLVEQRPASRFGPAAIAASCRRQSGQGPASRSSSGLQARFHDRCVLLDDGPGRSLALLVDHALDGLCLAGRLVLIRAGDNAFLADGQLQKHVGQRTAVIVDRHRKHAQRHPLGVDRGLLGDTRCQLFGLLTVLRRRIH